MKPNITMIGMPSSGKSTIGVLLCLKLQQLVQANYKIRTRLSNSLHLLRFLYYQSYSHCPQQ